MAIEFRCDACQKLLRVNDEHAGQPAKCPECGHVSQVPTASVGSSPAAPVVQDPPVDALSNPAADTVSQNPFADPWSNDPSQAKSVVENPYAPPRLDPAGTGLPTGRPLPGPLASRWKRLGGSILDGLIYVVAMAPGFVAMLLLEDGPEELVLVALLVLFGGLLFVAVYNWYLITVSGQSIAKKVLGMRILNTGGELPGFGMGVAVRQWIPLVINQFCSLFSLVDALFIFGEERRCLHDYMANTVVVDTEAELPPVSVSPTAAFTATTSLWTCANCGVAVPETRRRCSTCGEPRA